MAFKASPKRLGVLGFWASWIFFNVRIVGELASKGLQRLVSCGTVDLEGGGSSSGSESAEQ